VIFDRGGFSPKLIARLDKQGFDVMTIPQGKPSPGRFQSSTKKNMWWRGCYHYQLAERKRVKVDVSGPSESGKPTGSDASPQFLWMREVRVLRTDGRQTAIPDQQPELEQTKKCPIGSFHTLAARRITSST